MYASATIEPRLIALLNETSPESFISSHLDLPPLQGSTVQKTSSRPFPLEPQAGSRRDKSASLVVQQTRSFTGAALSGGNERLETSNTLDRTLVRTSPQSLRKILDDVPVTSQSSTSKKRQRSEGGKDAFVQLPQPPKKQKAAKQVVPPIIIGLFEPPPNAALFPPISSSAFHDSHGRNSLNVGPLNGATENLSNEPPPKNREESLRERKLSKTSGTGARKKKKWLEAETTHLLLGVQKYGLGCWKQILDDPEFKFDGRRAVDLKDRFRTCCPKELCKSNTGGATEDKGDANGPRSGDSAPPSRTGDCGSFSVNSSDIDGRIENVIDTEPSNGTAYIKSRSHRKNVKDLVLLGIKEPFKKSQRKERRPFSDEEDAKILRGFEEYGASWSSIQKDPRFGLEARRPTDLRDRLRNKYPEKFRSDDARVGDEGSSKSTSHIDKVSRSVASSHSLIHLSVQDRDQTQPRSLSRDSKQPPKPLTQLPPPSTQLKDIFADLLDQSTVNESTESLFDWGEGMAPYQGSLGDMDISRILLDDTCDSWGSSIPNIQVKPKQSFTDISSICTSTEPNTNPLLPAYSTSSYEPSQIISLPAAH